MSDPVVAAMFKAYCEIRGMDPADWPIIGDRKQAAWNAASEAARKEITNEINLSAIEVVIGVMTKLALQAKARDSDVAKTIAITAVDAIERLTGRRITYLASDCPFCTADVRPGHKHR